MFNALKRLPQVYETTQQERDQYMPENTQFTKQKAVGFVRHANLTLPVGPALLLLAIWFLYKSETAATRHLCSTGTPKPEPRNLNTEY